MIIEFIKKNNINKIISILLMIFFVEVLLHLTYYILKDRSFYSYHLNKNNTFTEYSIHGGLKFKKNILAHMPGYPDNLFTNKYGFIDNDNFIHNLNDSSKLNIFMTGGSTVEGRGASSNLNTIPSNLERCLLNKIDNVQVINAGFSGDFSYQEFMRVAGKILPNYKVDMIIHFGAKNDAHNVFAEGNNWQINNQKYFRSSDYFFNNLKIDCISCSIANKLDRLSLIFYSLNYYYKKYLLKKYNNNKKNNNFSIAKKNINKSIKNYKNNLSLMNNYYKDYGIEFYAFIQPYLHSSNKIITNNEKFFLDKFEREIGINYHDYIKNYFNIISDIDFKYNVYDISQLFKNEAQETFYDSFHYNDLGNKIIANSICKQILN